MPHSLSDEDAHTAAIGCQELLESYKITDVEVEFRESIFARSASPKLLKYVSFKYPLPNPSPGVRGPLTPALGLRIAAQATPYAEGTGALYISEGHNRDKVYILSARHVVFPPDAGNNELYNHIRWEPRRKVLLLGPKAFQALLKSTMISIGKHKRMVDIYKQKLDNLKDDDDAKGRMEIELNGKERVIKTLNQFHDEITKYWSEENQRILGHIAYSPPIAVGTGAERYTEDWALIELDRNKIDWNTFKGNVIDLGKV
jgi:hypothetical protein